MDMLIVYQNVLNLRMYVLPCILFYFDKKDIDGKIIRNIQGESGCITYWRV